MIFGILFNSIVANGQFTVDLGNDTSICVGLYGITSDSVFIGTGLNITNGTPPYTYSWSCNYLFAGVIPLSAGNFLNDTTLSNPQFIDYIDTPDYLTFFLKVTDNLGNICTDSIIIRFSSFNYSLIEYQPNINQGDSFQFYGTPFIGNGIPPLSFLWTPPVGLDNSTSLSAWASPDTTTFYSLTATDSMGCVSDTNVYYKVFVTPTGIYDVNRNKNNLLSIYPNPAKEKVTIKLEKSIIVNSVYLLNLTGKQIKNFDKNNAILNLSNIPKGQYILKIDTKEGVFNEHIIKE